MTTAQLQTQIQSGLETAGQILTADFKYRVPLHQRDFSWTLEEVGQLWEDITEAMEEPRPEYFLGTIVVTENRDEKIRSVIDGQQRLAALTMILAAIRSAYAERNDDRQGEISSLYLGMKDRRTRRTEPRFSLNTTNREAFEKFIVAHVPLADVTRAKGDKKQGPSNVLLIKAAEFIRERVDAKTNVSPEYENFLCELEDFIRDRVVLILVRVGDEADAYLIFETLNDRGLELSVSDLLKNYLYGRAGNELERVQKLWEETIFLLGSQDATQFLRHYWLSRYGVVRERDLYKQLKSKFPTQQKVLNLMSELRSAAENYAAISNVDHPVWKGYGAELRRDLETLQLFGLSQFRPLLLAALDSVKSDEMIPRVIRLVVVVSMRYSVIGSLGTGNIERAYSDAAVRVREGHAKTAAQIFSLLKSQYPTDDRFEADFAVKRVEKPKLARYVLTELANKLQGGKVLVVLEDEKKVTLEHVMPQSRSSGWECAAADESEYLEHVHRIGNLTLLEDKANKAASNAPFEEKKVDAYSQSEITITNRLCSYDEWTVSQIASRQQELAKEAVRVWSLPY